MAAIEAEDGQIFTGYCFEATSGVFHLCAERSAAFNMYQQSGQTAIKCIIAFCDKAPYGEGSGMPCGACREFLLQLSEKNKQTEYLWLITINEKPSHLVNSCHSGGEAGTNDLE